MLSTYQAVPVFGHERFKRIVKKPEFLARQNIEQMAIKIAEHSVKVQSASALTLLIRHPAQYGLKRSGPVRQHCRRPDPYPGGNIELSKRTDLLATDSSFFVNRSKKANQP